MTKNEAIDAIADQMAYYAIKGGKKRNRETIRLLAKQAYRLVKSLHPTATPKVVLELWLTGEPIETVH